MGIPMSESNLSLEGKVALVIGGGTGIGRGIALEFARAGADIAVASRRLAVLKEVEKDVISLGRRSLTVQTDITKRKDVDNLVQKVSDEFGMIDILVNSAGAGRTPRLLDGVKEWDSILDIELTSVYLCCLSVAKKMIKQQNGNIINITTVDRWRPPPQGCSIFHVAKAGVQVLNRGLAWELSPYNIRVNAISPGWIQTQMTSKVWKDPELLRRKESDIMLGRIGKPIDIATVALFLASEASNYITGETIIVDGGCYWSDKEAS
jgi:NAD(P)-dependent dehydrogenase (short-subunit alcohol dehydrogenase family)